ncbi:MAG: methylmalonyl Co-A mutase-associated GTPase MeaB [Dongiaceae bacterium]
MSCETGDTAMAGLRAGGKSAIAAALADLERRPEAPEVVALLDAAWRAPRAHVIGVTGPPGVGKSTLLGVLIAALRKQGSTVGVIAVDPSSRKSGGALLGDRVRLATDANDEGVFVRSMAARDRLGGLAELTVAAMVIMRAAYDVVMIETVGVGQSETDVTGAADTVLFCVQPGSGDSLQFMKSGIVEIPDIIAVTKGDLGAPAARARGDVVGALSLGQTDREGWTVPVLTVSALERRGIAELLAAIAGHRAWLEVGGQLAARRHDQGEAWLEQAVRDRFGKEGLRRAGQLSLSSGESPFQRLKTVNAILSS